MNEGLTPELAAAVSSRLLRIDPRLREMMTLEQLPIAGRDLEGLLSGMYLVGVGDGIGLATGKDHGLDDDLVAAFERLPETG